ncbi:MAG: alpha-ribazole phosphatase [Thermodesulfobacteriota bacterium]
MIYLLRHGKIQAGPKKRFIGQTDCGLSAAGRLQAESWRAFFKTINLPLILCSDLKRSLETAGIIAGRQADTVYVETRLREIHLGEWEDREMAKIRAEHPNEWEKRGQDLAGFRPPKGESFADLDKRVAPVLAELGAAEQDNLLIVGHAGVNRVLICRILGMPLQNLFRLGQDYGCLNIIYKKETHYQIQGLNMCTST